jgi:GMP reductase
MRIEDEVKLDFKDVLIRPKRSTLSSRKQVSLEREYKFKYSKQEWVGIPIIASNMDGVGTFEMASALEKHQMFTCLVKTYNNNIDSWIPFNRLVDPTSYAVSCGISDADFDRLNIILTGISSIKFICIDVANGYSERFGDYVSKVRTDISSTYNYCR